MGDGDGGGIVLDNFDALDNGVVAFFQAGFNQFFFVRVFQAFCNSL